MRVGGKARVHKRYELWTRSNFTLDLGPPVPAPAVCQVMLNSAPNVLPAAMRTRPATRLRHPRKSMTPKAWVLTPARFLRPEQVAVLRATLEKQRRTAIPKSVRDAMIIELLLGSGLRVSEACAVTVGDVHLQGDSPAVFVRHGKGGRPRLVPISLRLSRGLLEFLAHKAAWGQPLEPRQPLFLGQHGVSLTRFALTKIWKETLRSSGLPTSWGIHATRHSYAVELYRRTKDLRLTQRVLGHSSVVTTMVYASLLDEDIRAGVERVWA